MKVVLLTLIVCIVSAKQLRETKAINGNDAKDFLLGFALAIRVGEFVPELFGCITSAQNVIQNAHESVALVHQGGLENIMHAIQKMTVSLNDGASQCGDTVVEGRDYIKEINSKVHDEHFFKNARHALQANSEIIIGDVVEVMTAKKNNDYLTAGIRVGDIARIIIWGDANPQ